MVHPGWRLASRMRVFAVIVLGMAGVPAAASSIYSQAVLADNPVAYYRLNETSLTTVENLGTAGAAADAIFVNLGDGTGPGNINEDGVPYSSMGPGNRSVHFGANYEQGSSANRIVKPYAGAGDPLALDGTTGLTLEAWIYLDPHTPASANDNEGIVGRYQGRSDTGATVQRRGYVLYYDDDDNSFGMTMGSPSGTNVAANAFSYSGVPFGEWLHVAGTLDPGNRMRLYINGEMVAERTNNVPSTLYTGEADFWIGQQFGSLNFPEFSFEGRIDEVAVYDYELSEMQLMAHYRAGTVPEPGSFALMAAGSIGLLVARRWHRGVITPASESAN